MPDSGVGRARARCVRTGNICVTPCKLCRSRSQIKWPDSFPPRSGPSTGLAVCFSVCCDRHTVYLGGFHRAGWSVETGRRERLRIDWGEYLVPECGCINRLDTVWGNVSAMQMKSNGPADPQPTRDRVRSEPQSFWSEVFLCDDCHEASWMYVLSSAT